MRAGASRVALADPERRRGAQGGSRRRAALVAAAALATYRFLVMPWQSRWGATDEEASGRLPGDELVAEPAAQATRAITVEAPVAQVWPWVVQLGADRGGFYSYDWLENLFGLGIHSAERIVPEWQQRAVGDLVAARAKGSGWWYVADVRPDEALVLQVVNPRTQRPTRRDESWGWEFLWTFALREAGPSRCRLLVRERVGYGNRVRAAAMAPVGLVSFVMTRRMLLGIKERAEALHAGRPMAGPSPRPRPTGPARVLLRAPVVLYRWHLGRVLGRRFVLLEHRGRRTGQLRQTVLEVVDRDEGCARVVVCSGWGERSDWLRNVTANAQVCFETGGIRRCGTAQRLDREAAEAALRRYGVRHPRALRALAKRMLGDDLPPDVGGTAASVAAVLPVVALTA